jgi:hypothetical protein
MFVGSENLESGSREYRLGRWMYDDVLIHGTDWGCIRCVQLQIGI